MFDKNLKKYSKFNSEHNSVANESSAEFETTIDANCVTHEADIDKCSEANSSNISLMTAAEIKREVETLINSTRYAWLNLELRWSLEDNCYYICKDDCYMFLYSDEIRIRNDNDSSNSVYSDYSCVLETCNTTTISIACAMFADICAREIEEC